MKQNDFLLVTYETHEMAQQVLHTLRNKDAMQKIMENIKEKAKQMGFEENVCPPFLHFEYNWSTKIDRKQEVPHDGAWRYL